MKPLQDIGLFLKRFNHFKDGEFRSIEILSPTSMLIILAGQDEARAFDWQSVKLEFQGVVDAQLIEDKKCSLIDMSNGISLLEYENTLAFAIGECYNISNIKTSTCYIQTTTLKYEEGSF